MKAPVEFGAKLDLSIDAYGYARIEKMSFDAYNESSCLKDAVDSYYERTRYYPERVLVDQIYRTRDNRAFCQEHGIRLSGPKLERLGKTILKADKKTEYQDNADRIIENLRGDMPMPQAIQNLLEQYILEIKKIYAFHLQKGILYGSNASCGSTLVLKALETI